MIAPTLADVASKDALHKARHAHRRRTGREASFAFDHCWFLGWDGLEIDFESWPAETFRAPYLAGRRAARAYARRVEAQAGGGEGA